MAAGALSAGIDFGLGGLSSKLAWSRQKRVLQKSIQWRTADMRKAGLNPLLAIAPGGGGGGSAPSAQPPPQFGQAAQSALQITQLKKGKQEIDLMRQQGHLMNAQVGTALAQSRHYRLMGNAILPQSIVGLTAQTAYDAAVKAVERISAPTGEAPTGAAQTTKLRKRSTQTRRKAETGKLR